jgi:uncharacterized protein (TIGR02996 family)
MPSFARAYAEGASPLLHAIRSNPSDPVNWLVFGDWLEEHGLPRCEPSTHQLPRADGPVQPVVHAAAPASEADRLIDQLYRLTPEQLAALSCSEVSTKGMGWVEAERMMTVEASSLGLKSMPMRLRVKSYRTGEVRDMGQCAVVRDPEGELQYIDYSDDEYRLRVFND